MQCQRAESPEVRWRGQSLQTWLVEFIRVIVSLPERTKACIVMVDKLVEVVGVAIGGQLSAIATDNWDVFCWDLEVRDGRSRGDQRRALGSRGKCHGARQEQN